MNEFGKNGFMVKQQEEKTKVQIEGFH